ncbi:MAG: LytTR family DNA-binding domain-containing protein [Saprospiraceae bacterium]|nr:LytTR family DNA-binding domain-containing protein [Saprospiraceae bacterium]
MLLKSRSEAKVIPLISRMRPAPDERVPAPCRLLIPLQDTVELVPLADILFVEADGNYARVHLTDGQVLCHSKPLNTYDALLSRHGFLRTHQSYLVHIAHLRRIDKRRSQLVLSNGATVECSRSRRQTVLNTLKESFPSPG